MQKTSLLIIFFFSLTCFKAFCGDSKTYLDQVLGELRSEIQIITELAASDNKAGGEHWRGREAIKDLDQLIYRNIEKIANYRLTGRSGHKVVYGTVFEPKEFQESNIGRATYDTVQQTRKLEFIKMCKRVSEAKPYLSLRLASHLCRLAEKDAGYDFQDSWELVDNWLSWSLSQTHEKTHSLHLDAYNDQYYLGKHPMDKHYFIAYVGVQTGHKENLFEYIEQYKKETPNKDESKNFAMMLFAKAVELYCADSNELPRLATDTFANSFQKQYRFDSSDLVTLFRYRFNETAVLVETAHLMSNIQHPSAEFFLYLIEELIAKKEFDAVEQVITIVCDKEKNVRLVVLPALLINHKNKKVLNKLSKHHEKLVLAAIQLGEYCLNEYPLNKPHHFCRNSEIEKLYNYAKKLKDEESRLMLGQKIVDHYEASKKKFSEQKWYQNSKILESPDKE